MFTNDEENDEEETKPNSKAKVARRRLYKTEYQSNMPQILAKDQLHRLYKKEFQSNQCQMIQVARLFDSMIRAARIFESSQMRIAILWIITLSVTSNPFSISSARFSMSSSLIVSGGKSIRCLFRQASPSAASKMSPHVSSEYSFAYCEFDHIHCVPQRPMLLRRTA